MPVFRCILAKSHAFESNKQIWVLWRFGASNTKHSLQKIQKFCLSLPKIDKTVLTLHMQPKVRASCSHLPNRLSWPIYVHSFIPSSVSLFKQCNSDPILLSNQLPLRSSDWVQQFTRIFWSTGTAAGRRSSLLQKEKRSSRWKLSCLTCNWLLLH